MEQNNKIVIFNSSPLINLAKIDKLSLIEKLYGKIIIPEAVYNEVFIAGKNKNNTIKIFNLVENNLVEIIKIKNKELVKSFSRELDYGESEVIALAIDLNADLVVIDEIEARNIADVYDLNKTGFIGILIKAEKLGLVNSALELIDLAIEEGFRIDKKLYEYVKNILE